MKKLLAIAAALLLVFSSASFAAPSPRGEKTSSERFGGYVVGGNDAGCWVGFGQDTPEAVEVFDSMLTTYAAAYHDGYVYGYVYGYDESGTLHDYFYRAKAKNYSVEYIEGASSGGEFVYGMAYDPLGGTMYALCDEDHPYIASVDLENGELTRVVDIELGSLLGVMTLAIDGSGEFYLLTFSALSSKLMRLDTDTGALSLVMDTGLPCYWAQSMTWDPSTDAIYWAHAEDAVSSNNGLYRIDIDMNTVTALGTIGTGLEIMGLHVVPDEEPHTSVMGDLNGDGLVTSEDALLALRYSMGIIGPEGLDLGAGDVNTDGVVDSSDALLILRYALGIIEEL